MKKIKLLTPLLSAAAVAGIVLPMASCACSSTDSFVIESKDIQKEQTIETKARYILILDKDTYSKSDINVKLVGDKTNKLFVSYFVTNNMLVVEVSPAQLPDEEEETYTFSMDINVGSKTKEITGFKLTVLPGPEEPTVDEHLVYEYNEDTNGYDAYCDLDEDEKPNWEVKKLYLASTYDDGEHGVLPVTGIKNNGFYNCTSITKLIIPESIQTIGSNAFGCYDYESSDKIYKEICTGNINQIKFIGTSQLKSIEEYAFYGQKNLKSITIPKSVTSLSYCVFQCEDRLYIKQDKHWIGDDVCAGQLESVIFEQGSELDSIGAYTFAYQNKLTSIHIPDSVTSIEAGAFLCYDYSETYENNEELWSVTCAGSLKEVIFGKESQLSEIGDSAFYGQKALTTFDLPNSVESIGEYAFSCIDYIESEYNYIKYEPVGNIKTFNIDINESELAYIDSDAFSGQKELTSINIPASLVNIASYYDSYTQVCRTYDSFTLCKKLAKFNVHEDNEYIRTNDDGTMLIEKVTDPSENEHWILASYPTATGEIDLSDIDVTLLGDFIFYWNTNLTKITLPNTLTSLTYSPFIHCNNLTDLTIGEHLSKIDTSTFEYCPKLSNFIVESKNESFESIKIDSTSPILIGKMGTLHDQIYLWAYPTATGDIDLTDSKYDNIMYISSFAFANTPITSFKPNDNIRIIESYAFDDCRKLKSFDFNKVAKVYYKAFLNCEIETLTIDSSNTRLKLRKDNTLLVDVNDSSNSHLVFSSTKLNKDIDFANDDDLKDIKEIGQGSINIDSINLISLGNIVTIENSAFYYKTFENDSITIPASTTTINCEAFGYAEGIKTITFTDTNGWICDGESINVNDPVNNAYQLTQGQWHGEWIHKQ